MAARLREAQAQAELRALRQRVLQLETQVGAGPWVLGAGCWALGAGPWVLGQWVLIWV